MLDRLQGSKDLVTAWVLLIGLSLLTTSLSAISGSSAFDKAVAAGVLILAGLKARLILGRYLDVQRSRFWTRGFDLAIGGFLVLCFGLHLAA